MAASDVTVQKIIEVMQRHITEKQFRAIIEELQEIPGNKSFRNTIIKIASQLGEYNEKVYKGGNL